MQKQLEKSITPSNESKSKAAPTEESNDYRSVAPPHKFSDAAYDEQKKQIANDMDEAVQIAADIIQRERMKKKKKSSTAVSTDDVNDDDEKVQVESMAKKRRHSDEKLEDGEVTTKKSKQEKGVRGAFYLGIDLGDISSDDEDVLPVNNTDKKKLAQKQ
jgi:hypothetical protein